MSRGVIAQIDVKRCTSNGTAHFLHHFSFLNAAAPAEVLQHRHRNILAKVGLRKFFKLKLAQQHWQDKVKLFEHVPEELSSSLRKV